MSSHLQALLAAFKCAITHQLDLLLGSLLLICLGFRSRLLSLCVSLDLGMECSCTCVQRAQDLFCLAPMHGEFDDLWSSVILLFVFDEWGSFDLQLLASLIEFPFLQLIIREGVHRLLIVKYHQPCLSYVQP